MTKNTGDQFCIIQYSLMYVYRWRIQRKNWMLGSIVSCLASPRQDLDTRPSGWKPITIGDLNSPLDLFLCSERNRPVNVVFTSDPLALGFLYAILLVSPTSNKHTAL